VIRTPSAYHSLRLLGLPVSLNKNTKPLIKLRMTQINKITMTTLSTGTALQAAEAALYQRAVMIK
jgi:hypothetical protein